MSGLGWARAAWLAYLRSTEAMFQRFEMLLLPIGLCGAFGMPLYYVIWRELFPQPYENLPLRLVSSMMCLLVAAKPLWPRALLPYLPLAWHVCLLFCVPFFFSFMVLMNGGSPVWLVTWLCGFFMLVVMVSWMNLVLLLIVGVSAAAVAYQVAARTAATTSLDWLPEQIPVFLFALVAGTLISYRRGVLQQERFSEFSSLARNLARELNGPVRNTTAAAIGLKQYLPVIIQAVADRAGAAPATIPDAHVKTLEEAPVRIQTELQRMNAIVQMLAGNCEEIEPSALSLDRVAIGDCVRLALRRYPFASDAERRIVRWRGEPDFVFTGSQDLTVRALMNVLKVALLSVVKRGRGEVEISQARGAAAHTLTVAIIGLRIPSQLLSRAFAAPSFLEAASGTGAGLYFAKRAVEACGGELLCANSREGDTCFEFRFPGAAL